MTRRSRTRYRYANAITFCDEDLDLGFNSRCLIEAGKLNLHHLLI
ncbi:MAG: hypothetical protein RMY33_020910 [Nostoc sp. DedQUE03]|nr:hypothetical protein [Nostoc sp. DedQUE02]